ncbi:MAG: hypothetical protein Kow00108_07780 [Calditrichia bacterium]
MQDYQNIKALIVDDEIDLANLLSAALKQKNINAIPVNDVDHAINKLKEQEFDLIVSDIYLPRKTGKDLFNYVIDQKLDIPFIFITGNPDVHTAVQFMQKGGYDYIIKPFQIDEFLEKVDVVLTSHKQKQKDRESVTHLREILNARLKELKIYKDIFYSLTDAIIITDSEGSVVSANDVLKKITGYEFEEIENSSPAVLLGKNRSEILYEQIFQLARESGRWSGELTNRKKNGDLWDAILNVLAIKDENKETFAYAWQLKDITDLKQAQNRVIEYYHKIAEAHEAIIFGMAKLAEYRDMETGYHLERIRSYCKFLAEKLREHPDFQSQIDDTFIDNIFRTAPLHDIGKVGISDTILRKRGKLTTEEFETIKLHTIIGYQTLNSIRDQYGEMDFLKMGIEIAYSHHEKWDGSGYPLGLKGEEIPLAARILSIADVYDALTNKRVYKPAYSHSYSLKIMKEMAESSFDKRIFDMFLEYEDKFFEIHKNYIKIEEENPEDYIFNIEI